jgi:hypothetical protein
MQVYNNIIGDESSSGWVGIEVQGTPAVLINNNKFTINGGGNSNISGPTTVESSLKASHNPEYPVTDSNGKSILEGNDTSSGSTGGNSGSDGTGDGSESGNTGLNDGNSGIDGEGAIPSYPYSPDSHLPEIKVASVLLSATASEDTPVTPLYPTPSDVPGTAKDACTVKENSAGLIPCGRNLNDPATSWNECDECNLCSIVLTGELIINFLLKMAAIAAVLAIIVSGFVYIFAAGKEKTVSTAKAMLKYALFGFVIIFTSWMIVNSILTTFGYVDPVEGEWYTVCGSSSGNSSK